MFDIFDDRRPVRQTALICERGHGISNHLENLREVPRFCEECGARNIYQCPACQARILGDLSNVYGTLGSPPLHCHGCGKSYPWRTSTIRKAREATSMQAEIHELDEASQIRLNAFVNDLAEQSASPEQTATFMSWFNKKFGGDATKTIGNVLKDVATGAVSDVIKKAIGL